MHRAARVALPALTFLVAIVSALVVTATIAGGADGLLVARAIVAVVLDLATGLVLGVLTFVLLVLPAADARRGRLLDVAAGAAAVWTVAAAATAFLLYLGAAPPVSDPAFGPGIVTFVVDIALGRSWFIAAVLAAVLTAALVAVRSPAGVAVVGIAAVIAVVPEALQGPLSGESLATARAVAGSDLLQLAGTGAWIGIAALTVVLDPPSAALRRAVGLEIVLGVVVIAAALLRLPLEAAENVSSLRLLLPIAVLAIALGVVAAARRGAARGLQRSALVVLGGALGSTAGATVVQPTTADPAARTSPAEILTGSALPDPLSPIRLVAGWQPDPFWLIVCAALVVAYLAGALGRDGGGWPAGRLASWVLGVALLGWLTSGGPAVYAPVLLSAHLAQHAALLLLVPLLLAGGAPARLLHRLVPEDAGIGSVRGGLVAAMRSASARPATAVILAILVIAALYGTGWLGWSLTDPVGAAVSIAVCVAAGSLVVASVTSREVSRRAAVVAVVVLLLVEAAGAAALAVGSGLLLASWFGAMGWGTDALVDQRTGAVVAGAILLVPTIVLLVAAARKAPGTVGRPRPAAPIQEEVPA